MEIKEGGTLDEKAEDSEVDSVLKGVARAKKFETLEDFLEHIVQKV